MGSHSVYPRGVFVYLNVVGVDAQGAEWLTEAQSGRINASSKRDLLFRLRGNSMARGRVVVHISGNRVRSCH